PIVKNLAAEFVAEHHVAIDAHRVLDTGLLVDARDRLGELQRVQVGAADAAGAGAHQNLTRTGREIGDLVAHDPSAAPDGCSHGIVLPEAAITDRCRLRSKRSRECRRPGLHPPVATAAAAAALVAGPAALSAGGEVVRRAGRAHVGAARRADAVDLRAG